MKTIKEFIELLEQQGTKYQLRKTMGEKETYLVYKDSNNNEVVLTFVCDELKEEEKDA